MEIDAVVTKNCRLFCLIGQVVLLISSLFTVSTFLPIELTNFSVDGKDYKFSLFRSVNIEGESEDYNYSCFEKMTCDESDGLCDMGKRQQRASLVYTVMAGLGVVCQLLVIERLGAMRNKLDYGHGKVMWIIIILGWALTFVGSIFWLGYGQIKFQGSCSSSALDSTVDVCASSGASIVPTAICLVTIGTAIAAMAMRNRNTALDIGIKGVANGTIAGQSHRKWLLKVLFAQAASLLFISMSLNWRWVHYQDTVQDSKYYGKLFNWESFDSEVPEDLGYSCLSTLYCNDDNQRYCDGFRKLDKASQVFLGFEVLAVISLIFWFEPVMYLLMKREFGFTRLNFVWAPLSFTFHICAFASFVGVSEVSFGGKCELKQTSDTLKFCAEQGPQFIMWTLMCITFGALFSDLVYLRRYVRGKLLLSNMKSVTYKAEGGKKVVPFSNNTSMNMTQSEDVIPTYLKKKEIAVVVPQVAEPNSVISSSPQLDSCIRCNRQ
jgi:hypothetical protein